MFSGVWSRCSREPLAHTPRAAHRTARGSSTTKKVDRMGRSPARSPLPKRWAARIDSPWVKPVMAMVKNTLTAVVAPTAARALSPTAWPTIKASAQL